MPTNDEKAVSNSKSKRKRRIVPDDQRKRIAVSCDRCRKRKLRCRASEPTDSKANLAQPMENEPCIECVRAKTECTRVLPRKKRVYGSVETLSLHYQALLFLVKSLFPDEPCESMEDVVSIARKKGIDIPDNLQPESVPESSFLNPTSGEEDSPEDKVRAASPNRSRTHSFLRPHAERTVIKVENKEPVLDIGDERIIYDRVGVPYYVGSAGSMAFFDSLCKIIGKNEQKHKNGNNPLQPDTLREGTEGAFSSSRKDKGVYFCTISDDSFAQSAMFSLPNIDQISLLPPKPECDVYFEAFLKNVNSLYPMFRLKKLRQKYEQYWSDIQSTPAEKSKWETQIDWRCCLYMIIVMGSRSLIVNKATSKKYNAMSKYASVVQGALSILTVTTSTETVQALFLLSFYFYGINERNAAWLMLGLACRQAMAMGFHRENACVQCSPEEAQERRQVWYFLYTFELTLCASLGRPSCIRYDDMDIRPPDESDEEMQIYFAPGLFTVKPSLTQYFAEVITDLSLGDFSKLLSFTTINRTLSRVRELKEYLGTLPQNLRELQSTVSDFHARSIMRMHILTHYTISILTRPFVLYIAGTDLKSISPQKIDNLITILNVGAASAIAISQFLKALNRRGLLSGVYHTEIFYGYCSCLVLSIVSVASTSGKFAHKNLAFSKETINDSILTIIKIMDTVHLEGTVFSLARGTAKIVRGLNIDIDYENIKNPAFPAKEEPADPPSTEYSEGSYPENQVSNSNFSSLNPSPPDFIPEALLEDYDRAFTSHGYTPITVFDAPSVPQSTAVPAFDLEELDRFTETYNQSFHSVPHTFDFSNIIFPLKSGDPPEESLQSFPSDAKYQPINTGMLSGNAQMPLYDAPVPSTAPESSASGSAPSTDQTGSGSSMAWVKEDLGRNQLMEYVTKQAQSKPQQLQ